MEAGPETDRRIEVASGDLPEGVKPGEQNKAETETDNDQIATPGKDAQATDEQEHERAEILGEQRPHTLILIVSFSFVLPPRQTPLRRMRFGGDAPRPA